jgi:hypothetical protein
MRGAPKLVSAEYGHPQLTHPLIGGLNVRGNKRIR